MLDQTHVFAAVAGYVGRPEATGAYGVFRRPAAPGGEWQNVFGEKETHYVMVHPADPNVVLAGTIDGVYRSTDKGLTFARADFPETERQIWSFMVDSRDANRVYAGASPVGVFISEDRGASWRALPDPGIAVRLTSPFACRVMRLAQHPTKPNTIFAALEFGGAMVSHDSGENWADCGDPLVEMSKQPHLSSQIATDSTAEGMLDGHALTIAPDDPDAVVIALRMGLFESRDGGKSWQDKEVDRFSPTTYGRDVRVGPSEPGTLYAALSVAAASEDGGLYRSTDKGETWQRFDKVQVHGTIMSIGLHRQDANQVYIGARYNGEVFGTQDGGATWSEMSIPGEVKDIYCVTCG
jgi:photosystem II stability/assembly factor-like uncharacterized protein